MTLNELNKLFNGISLVCKEIASRNGGVRGGAGDFQTLIKTAVLSATDITGLTKGNIVQFSPKSPRSHSNSSSKDSVVFFAENVAAAPPVSNAGVNDAEVLESSYTSSGDGVVGSQLGGEVESSNVVADVAAGEAKSVESSNAVADLEVRKDKPVVVVKKRKLRERKVPSTSFSRALG